MEYHAQFAQKAQTWKFGTVCNSTTARPVNQARIWGIDLQEILQYLKDHGERLDSEIAAETGISLEEVCLSILELSAKGDVIMCRSTRYIDGKKIEGMLCRVAGYVPHASPGRKSKAPM